jgi:3-methylfumaryl-CoA hydratase
MNSAALDETRAWIGREQVHDGADEVTRSDIRRKLEVYGFDCPLHTDDATARAHGYRTTPAPGAMIPLWAMPPYWAPGDPPLFGPGRTEKDGSPSFAIPTPYPNAVNAASEVEYFEPVYPGDRLCAVSKLVDVKPRETRLGEGVFLTTETTIAKKTGEQVSVRRNSTFRYAKREDGERPARDSGDAAPATNEVIVDNAPVDWGRQQRFGDVRAGDDVPTYRVWLSYQRIVMSIAVDRMFSPIHHNRDFARAAGLPDIIFNTRGYETVLEITLRRWIGLSGRLRKFGPFRMVSNGHPGDTLVCNARVTKTESGENARTGLVTVSLTVDSPRGQAATGEAIVELPQ